ncbi:MAG: hypothetical protein ACYDHH_15935 [Solirubrobacteraceae bacterium]
MDVQLNKKRLRALAGRQAGRVSRAQLASLGFGRGQIEWWIGAGYLRPTLPGVLALGHDAPSPESDLWEAVLYAGPGAALSHGTAAYWRRLIIYPPREIHVSTPRQIKSLPGIVVHGRQRIKREIHRGLPVTTIRETMIGLAATSKHNVVRRALAQLDYQDLLDVEELHATCRHGKPGSVALRAGIADHQPQLAFTNGENEDEFFFFCERHDVTPLPLVNVEIFGIEVDNLWPDHGLVVELDGDQAHRTPAQRRKDHRNDIELRGHDLVVARYDWDLVHNQPKLIYTDLTDRLAKGTGWTIGRAPLVITRRKRPE